MIFLCGLRHNWRALVIDCQENWIGRILRTIAFTAISNHLSRDTSRSGRNYVRGLPTIANLRSVQF